jgi:formamidopyrimidine-DNA glycosylase
MDALQYMYRYPLEHERQQRAYWAVIRRENSKLLHQIEMDQKEIDGIAGEMRRLLHPYKERVLMAYEGLKCKGCGEALPPQDFGRPKNYCPQCFAKMRRAYQHAKYLERLKR